MGTITVKYALITVAVELDKQASSRLAALYVSNAFALADAAPSGTYAGSKTVLGEEIDATIVVHNDGTLDLKISGVIAIDCDAEKYTYADGTIALTDLDTAGDCAHDALADNHVTFKSSTYDASADSITITVKYALITRGRARQAVSSDEKRPFPDRE